MRTVESHFDDPKEKELALLVWQKGVEQLQKKEVKSGNTMTKVFFGNATIPNEQIMLLASDWISVTRGDGEPGSTENVNQQVGRPPDYFNGDQIANVEHAYRAAFLSITLTPAVSFLGAAGWELVIDPWIKEPLIRAYNASQNLDGLAYYQAIAKSLRTSYGLNKLMNSYIRNGGQFVGADMAGWMMGADLWDEFASTGGQGLPAFVADPQRIAQLRLQNGTKAFDQMAAIVMQPAAPPVAEAAPYVVKDRGTMLSRIAGERYKDVTLWPLIWDNNRAAIGANPNRVPVGITLQIKPRALYSQAQIADAKKRSPTWRNYPTG